MYPALRAAWSAHPPQIVFSAHGDTCFHESTCLYVPGSGDALYFGHMDNFAGVFALMSAHFSCMLPKNRVQCRVTHGEESGKFEGAREVMVVLRLQDFVVVIDVTGQCPRKVNEVTVTEAPRVIGHVLFEKVSHNEKILRLIEKLPGQLIAIDGVPQSAPYSNDLTPPPYTYEIWHHCNDPQATLDETDAYLETQENVVFLGVTTTGGVWKGMESTGDYNAGPVFCWKRDIESVSRAVVDLANVFVECTDSGKEKGDEKEVG